MNKRLKFFESLASTRIKVLASEMDSQRSFVDGIAVYCDWQATPEGWRQMAKW
jgi:hypothetical protein